MKLFDVILIDDFGSTIRLVAKNLQYSMAEIIAAEYENARIVPQF